MSQPIPPKELVENYITEEVARIVKEYLPAAQLWNRLNMFFNHADFEFYETFDGSDHEIEILLNYFEAKWREVLGSIGLDPDHPPGAVKESWIEVGF